MACDMVPCDFRYYVNDERKYFPFNLHRFSGYSFAYVKRQVANICPARISPAKFKELRSTQFEDL